MEALLRAHRQQLDDLPDDEPLPRRAHLGMRDDFLPGSEPQERVEDAGVVHIHLGRAHLPLGDVLVPRGQLPHGEHRGQGVQVAARGGVRDAEGAAELAAIPALPVPMRQHGPEAAQGGGGHQAAEFWDVSRQKGADEPVPPTPTRRAGAGKVGKWEAAAQPQALQVPHFLEAEAIKFVERHPPGEGLGGLPEQFRGSAAEHQKSCRRAWPVGQHPQQGEEVGQPLDIVQHHQPAQGPEFQPRIRQTGEVDGILQVEPCHGAAPGGRELSGEGRFAHLSRTEQRDHRKLAEEQLELPQVTCSRHIHLH